jgi:hypothetical protein
MTTLVVTSVNSLPRFYLLSRWLEIELHPIDADCGAIDERE